MLCDLSVNISTLWQFLTSLSTGHGLVEKAALKHCIFRLDALPVLKADSPQQYPRVSSRPLACRKSGARIDGGDPLQGPIGKPSEEVKGNTGNLELCSLR